MNKVLFLILLPLLIIIITTTTIILIRLAAGIIEGLISEGHCAASFSS